MSIISTYNKLRGILLKGLVLAHPHLKLENNNYNNK